MSAAPSPDGWVGVEHLLTAEQVAEALAATSRRTVDRYRRTGQLPGVLIGNTYRFRPEDVQAFIERRRAA